MWATSNLCPQFPLNRGTESSCIFFKTTCKHTEAPNLFCFFVWAACLKTPSQTQVISPHRSRRSLLLTGALGNPFWFFDPGILTHQYILSRESWMWLHTAVKVSHGYFCVLGGNGRRSDDDMGLGTPGYQSILPVGYRHPRLVINQSRSLHFSMWS